MYIERCARESRVTCLEAVLRYCEEHMIDPDEIASRINKPLKDKIEQDFRDLNYLPKKAQLDV